MAEIDESERPSVRQVCQDFRVREDGALAQRLQDEEFGHHYIRNRSERKTVREDVKAAKITYLEEVRNAQLLPDEEVQNMEHPEHWLARDLQEKLQQEEINLERKRRDEETRDEQIARQMQEKEALKLERARQRRLERQQREERETEMLQQAMAGLRDQNENHTNHREHAETQQAPAPVASRNGRSSPDSEDTRPRHNHTERSSTGREPENRYSLGEGAQVQLPPTEGGRVQLPPSERERVQLPPGEGGRVQMPPGEGGRVQLPPSEGGRVQLPPGEGGRVQMPPTEGGRLECDRIIMADGTAINLFDETDDKDAREKAHKRSRERQDEEFARKLQEEENKLLEQDRQAAHDRQIALEYQDREFAKELQRREYIRLQKLKRERQLRRAQTVPAESTSGSTGELQSHQRLPSYEEATHRNQIPDLLQDEPARTEYGQQRDDFSQRKYSSPESLANGPRSGSFEREKGLHRLSRTSSNSPTSMLLEREPLRLPESANSSPQSSLERSTEYDRQLSHRSSSGSSHSSSHAQTVLSPTSPDTREAVWERLYEEGEEIPNNARHHRGLERRSTVASSEPSSHELLNNGHLLNGNDCNIAEFIDPTFNRKSQIGNADESPTSTLTGGESRPKVVPLIQPHRRRSSDAKKKKDKEKECKQQ